MKNVIKEINYIIFMIVFSVVGFVMMGGQNSIAQLTNNDILNQANAVAPTMHSGWPQVQITQSKFVIADVDGNMNEELFLSNPGIGGEPGRVFSYNQSGTQVSGFPITINDPFQAMVGDVAVSKLNNDPINKVKLIAFSVFKGSPPRTQVYLYRYNPSIDAKLRSVVGWPKEGGYTFTPTPTLADIDNNAEVDVIVPQSNGVIVYRKDGSQLLNVSSPNYSVTSEVTVADLNGDNKLELIFASKSKVATLTAPAYINVLYLDMTVAVPKVDEKMIPIPILANGPIGADYKVRNAPAVADITGDGHPEIVVGFSSAVYAFKKNTEMTAGSIYPNFVPLEKFPQYNPQYMGVVKSSKVALGDIDQDGFSDIVSMGFDNHLWAWNGYGTALFVPPTFPKVNEDVKPLIADVDYDGYQEIVFKLQDTVRILDRKGMVKNLIHRAGEALSDIAIGEVDGDGKLEIAFGNTGTAANLAGGQHYLYDFEDLPLNYDREIRDERKLPWPAIGHDAKNTNTLSNYCPSNGLSCVEILSLNGGQVLNAQTIKKIVWAQNNVSKVNINITGFKNGVAFDESIVRDYAVDINSKIGGYDYSIPLNKAGAQNCRIKVSATQAAVVLPVPIVDISDAAFEIKPSAPTMSFNKSALTLTIIFSSPVNESGLSYQFRILRKSDNAVLQIWQSITGSRVEMALANLPVGLYYFQGRAVSSTGIMSIARASYVFGDTTPPTAPTVVLTPNTNATFTWVAAQFLNSVDPESGIIGYKYKVLKPDGTDLIAWRNTGVSIAAIGIPLSPVGQYIVQVKAINPGGLESSIGEGSIRR